MEAEPVIMDVLKATATLLLLPLATIFMIAGYRLFRVYRTDRSEYGRNKDRSPSFAKVSRRVADSGGVLCG